MGEGWEEGHEEGGWGRREGEGAREIGTGVDRRDKQ